MTTPREKFQKLLRELFQFDCADLDFGIYRIMNHKHAVIEQFIEKDLLNAVSEELHKETLAQEANAAERLVEITAQIKDTLGADALDVEGNLSPNYAGTKIGKEYLSLRQSAGQAKNQAELESQIFNHLYAFFSRYYDQGDFMSLRRYSKREKYAIPYNGEEVYLHWANSDQYYIKTGENFTDYSYKHGNWTVRFKLRNADVEQNNVKGARRFFIPKVDALELDVDSHELTLPFEYRPLISEEEAKFGRTKVQETILADALPRISAAAKSNTDALAALVHEKRRDAENNPVSLLEHHLRTYTQKNTRDFFIHKDLKGFLDRELDFYLKNEVLNLDELESVGQKHSESWFELLRIINSIGQKILAFVSQIEDFQKRLFEKKPLIHDAHYCVSLDKVPAKFYPLILGNPKQQREWLRLSLIQPESNQNATQVRLTLKYLKNNPFLMIDTQFYDEKFKDNLLASIDHIDDATDGVLVKSDSYGALRLLQQRYRASVSCICIDPPYNTGNDDFTYKDHYQHSSWLSMMENRMREAVKFGESGAAFFITIGEDEQSNLQAMISAVIGEHRYRNTIVWQKKDTPANDSTGISGTHDYLLVVPLDDDFRRSLIPRTEEQGALYKNPDNDPRGPWTRTAIIVKGFVAGNDFPLSNPAGKEVRPPAGTGWSMSWERLQELINDNRIWWGKDGKGTPFRKTFLSEVEEGIVPVTWWNYSFAGTNRNARSELRTLFQGEPPFDTPKPTALIRRVLQISNADIVLDYFAGSGTTGHAIINLNREDGRRRKYILVEAASHFETALKPRIQKVVYSNDWRDGVPTSVNGSTHIFKYMYLESYDDSLDNITFNQTKDLPLFQIDDYVLSYMLNFETKDSETFLNVSKLDSPFDYKLHRHGTDEPLPVDLPETFNYLIGLHVRTRRVYENNGTRYLVYRGKSKERETVIIWRTTRGWGQKEFEADHKFIEKEKLTEGAEDIFVNTDSFVSGARSLDPVFKRLMFYEE